ncbi:dyslexia-associated protein KIAA0319-like [Eucyclogobius newberryi]|uniref:dyslexia-associated protein KIAA0319-like n=1 Tax=Eucyclogobius newberryi TaxID=166745 RepID=UPI003B5BEEE9
MRDFVLLLLLLQDSLASRCWQASSFPSSVLPPLALGHSGAILRVPGAPSLPRCVDAACNLPGADVAWLFRGRCYVVSCQQRAQCRPQRRPGAQSHLVFIQRSAALLPPVFWGEYKSSEAPGDLEILKELDLLGSKHDYGDPDILLDDSPSIEDQSELKDGNRLNQLEAENETTPTAEKHNAETTQRPRQAAVTTQNGSVLSTLPKDSLPVPAAMTSLPVPAAMTSLWLLVLILRVFTASLGISVKNTTSAQDLLSTGSTPDSVKATPPATVPPPVPPTASHTTPPSPACPSPPRPTSRAGSSSLLLGSAPVAHAGGSHTLILPNNSLLLQGSVTNTDPQSVNYLWTRDAQSPAAGDLLFGSQSGSSLVLVNLVEGSYLFHLEVTDAWGRSASATATVQVLPEPGGGDEVELELQVCVSQVSVSQKDTLLSQISALLHVSISDVQLRRLYGHARLSTVLRFSVRSPSGLRAGQSVVSLLKSHLLNQRPDFLLFRALRVNTVECALQCSGRGQCDPVSRLCLCDSFWTENLLRTYMGDGESNCEWRLLFVILSGFILVLLILSAAWTFMCCCRRRKQTRVRRKTRYTILDNVDEQERVELRPRFSLKHRSTEHNSSLMMSESELSDQDFSREPMRSQNRAKPGLNRL